MMTRIVNHAQRKKEILQKALILFAEQGYSSVTFQKIADSCNISRTTLYRYFNDKREILDESVQNFFTPMLEKQREIADLKDCPSQERLRKILLTTIDSLCRERLTLIRILEYLLTRKSRGEEISEKITRHTWKLRLLMQRLLAEGIKNGEFRQLDLRIINNLLYSQLETLAFRLIVKEDTRKEDTIDVLERILTGLQAHE